ncbi:MAG: IS66 family transposase [Actinobacteria bacterium]|nr:IS66 family transposase [Actinomycetota bacterium]
MERDEAEAIFERGGDVVVALLLRMDEQIERLEKRVGQQDERIAQLERKVKRSSRNSSQPPSADPPSSAPRPGRDPSGRRQGAQAGHEGSGRELLPTSAVDEVIVHWPAACGCGHVFSEQELVALGKPVRHQVEELPQLAVTVTEHQCPRVRCPDCGKRRRAELPAAVAASAFGPRLHAAVAVLSVRNRVSRRDVVECCEQLFGARISSGTVDAVLERVSDALADPDADLLGRVRAAKALNMDETGWRTAGQRRALWGAFTDRHAVLRVRSDRHEDHAKELLADTSAIVTSDRWWAYTHLAVKRRQVCWAHLRRDFKAHAEGLAAEKAFGEAGLRICEELFWRWEIYQHTGDRRELGRRVRALRRELKPILRTYAGKQARYRRCRGMARNLLKLWPALWTFADHKSVEPTNNHAERALRGSVIYRKLSLGSQSDDGERRIERLLSVHTTCRLQRRPLHDYLLDAFTAHARGDPVPLLA